MALLHLERLRAQERLRVHRRRGRARERVEDLARTAEKPRLEQRRLHGDVGERDGDAFVDAAHARPDLEARVPACRDEAFGGGAAAVAVDAVGQENEDVDVRVREELAAAVAADGDQRRVGGHLRFAPELEQRDVDVARERADEAKRGARGRPRGDEAREPRRLGIAEARALLAGRARRHGGDVGARGRCRRDGDAVAGAHAASAQAWANAGGGGVPAETVSTS